MPRLGSREGTQRQRCVPSLSSAQSPCLRLLFCSPWVLSQRAPPKPGSHAGHDHPSACAEPFPGAPCACPHRPCCWLALWATAFRFLDPRLCPQAEGVRPGLPGTAVHPPRGEEAGESPHAGGLPGRPCPRQRRWAVLPGSPTSLPCPWAWRVPAAQGGVGRGWDGAAGGGPASQPRAPSVHGRHTSWNHALCLLGPPVPQEGGQSLLSFLQQRGR